MKLKNPQMMINKQENQSISKGPLSSSSCNYKYQRC